MRRQVLLLPLTKTGLHVTIDNVHIAMLADITDQVGRIHVMVTGVDIPIMLQGDIPSALSGMDTKRIQVAHGGTEGSIKMLYENPSCITLAPLLENFNQKFTKLIRQHAGCGNSACTHPFYNGYELKVLSTEFLESVIDFQGMIAIVALHRGQHIKLRTLFKQTIQTPLNLIERTLAAPGFPVAVVHIPGTIQADPHQEVVNSKEPAPGGVQFGAVGLQRILDPHAGTLVLVLQFDDSPEEIEPHQRRFAALPGKIHLVTLQRLVLDISFYMTRQNVIGHPELRARKHCGLIEVKTILAIEITERTDRFDHYVEGCTGLLAG